MEKIQIQIFITDLSQNKMIKKNLVKQIDFVRWQKLINDPKANGIQYLSIR